METKTKVYIQNTEYIIRAQLDPDYIQDLAEKINERIFELKKANPKMTDNMALTLTALNLMDELVVLKEKSESADEVNISNKTNRLISMLEKGLIGDSP